MSKISINKSSVGISIYHLKFSSTPLARILEIFYLVMHMRMVRLFFIFLGLIVPPYGSAVYAATKYGVVGLSRCLGVSNACSMKMISLVDIFTFMDKLGRFISVY